MGTLLQRILVIKVKGFRATETMFMTQMSKDLIQYMMLDLDLLLGPRT